MTMPNDECSVALLFSALGFGIRISSFIRHSGFVIRHSPMSLETQSLE
jgi:hypothetical protein